jgi:hypothetical protein
MDCPTQMFIYRWNNIVSLGQVPVQNVCVLKAMKQANSILPIQNTTAATTKNELAAPSTSTTLGPSFV